jgi:tRNA(Arg) A34 adenosine deaminase TadA
VVCWDHDSTAHSEVVALTQAGQKLVQQLGIAGEWAPRPARK